MMIDDVDEYEGMHGMDWAFSFVKKNKRLGCDSSERALRDAGSPKACIWRDCRMGHAPSIDFE